MAPERLDRFMARANATYYATRDPFADFTTAPEISQMFGELLGAWVAVVWQQMGAPNLFLLIEAGPGRGTLMADVLRCIGRIAPNCARAAHLHLIETSPRMRAEQAARGLSARWHDTIEDVPPGPAIVLANEFLDALPIRQFVRRQSGWFERHVEDGQFVDVATNGMALPYPEGTVLELAEAAASWTATLAARLSQQGGAALLLDYGPSETAIGDTLQALRGGRPADPLADPGQADLTAHVDFPALLRVGSREGARVWGPVTQGALLGELGLAERTSRLAAANPDRANSLNEAASRLSLPQRMGNLFKAICLTHPTMPAPPGFDTAPSLAAKPGAICAKALQT